MAQRDIHKPSFFYKGRQSSVNISPINNSSFYKTDYSNQSITSFGKKKTSSKKDVFEGTIVDSHYKSKTHERGGRFACKKTELKVSNKIASIGNCATFWESKKMGAYENEHYLAPSLDHLYKKNIAAPRTVKDLAQFYAPLGTTPRKTLEKIELRIINSNPEIFGEGKSLEEYENTQLYGLSAQGKLCAQFKNNPADKTSSLIKLPVIALKGGTALEEDEQPYSYLELKDFKPKNKDQLFAALAIGLSLTFGFGAGAANQNPQILNDLASKIPFVIQIKDKTPEVPEGDSPSTEDTEDAEDAGAAVSNEPSIKTVDGEEKINIANNLPAEVEEAVDSEEPAKIVGTDEGKLNFSAPTYSGQINYGPFSAFEEENAADFNIIEKMKVLDEGKKEMFLRFPDIEDNFANIPGIYLYSDPEILVNKEGFLENTHFDAEILRDSGGAFNSGSKCIAIFNSDDNYMKHVLGHEFGHYLDYENDRYSQTDDYKRLVENDLKNTDLSKFQTKSGDEDHNFVLSCLSNAVDLDNATIKNDSEGFSQHFSDCAGIILTGNERQNEILKDISPRLYYGLLELIGHY